MNSIRSIFAWRYSAFLSFSLAAGRDTSGGVLMEYVLVTAVTTGFLVGMAGLVFAPAGTAFTAEGALDGDNFGFFGNAFVAMYHVIMKGIALPIP